jgi:hypothetical protein
MNEKAAPCIGMKELESGTLDGPPIGIFRGQQIVLDFLGTRGGEGT